MSIEVKHAVRCEVKWDLPECFFVILEDGKCLGLLNSEEDAELFVRAKELISEGKLDETLHMTNKGGWNPQGGPYRKE